jgi:hypothetical protein
MRKELDLDEETEIALNNRIIDLEKEIDKQNKVIDETSKTIIKERGYKNVDEHPEWIENTKRFFFKKVENDERREKFLRKVEEDGK